MWKDFPLFPDKATELAGQVDALYFTFLGISAFFSLLIGTLVIYFAIRYRRRSEDEIGQPEKAGMWLELTWSIIPLLILMVMFTWGTKVYIKAYRPPANSTEYFVTAKQWPAGQPIKLTMTSEDVIHSFFVPAFRVKADVLPGRYTTIWFEGNKAGTYTLFCAEYCGAEHSLMMGSVTIMEPGDYEEWLAGVDKGRALAAHYMLWNHFNPGLGKGGRPVFANWSWSERAASAPSFHLQVSG